MDINTVMKKEFDILCKTEEGLTYRNRRKGTEVIQNPLKAKAEHTAKEVEVRMNQTEWARAKEEVKFLQRMKIWISA